MQQGLRLQERGCCASGPDGLAGAAPSVSLWAPLENLPGRLGPGDSGAAGGGHREKMHRPSGFSVPAACWPHPLQGFGCGQTGSHPHIAGSLLRGEDKNQVNAQQTRRGSSSCDARPLPRLITLPLLQAGRDPLQLPNYEQETV